MSKKITVVIPNYNGSKLLRRNLPDIIKNFPDSQIIISDDNSSDDSLNFLANNFPNVEIIANKTNKGFSSNVNSGVKKAKTPIVVLLNTDVAVNKDYTRQIENYFENENLFGIGFQDRSFEDKNIVLRGRGVGIFKKGLLNHAKGNNEFGRTLWISGGSCAVSLEKFKKLGGFNEIYNPFYWEDIDLSYRAIKSGWEILFAPEIVVDHFHEIGSIRKHHSADRITKIAARNMLIFSAKNITDKKILLSFYITLIQLTIKSLIKMDTNMLSSIMWFLLKYPKIITSRNNETKYYKLSDKEIINNFGNAG